VVASAARLQAYQGVNRMPLRDTLVHASTAVTVSIRRAADTASEAAAAVARSSTIAHTQQAISATSIAVKAAARRSAAAVTGGGRTVGKTCAQLVQQNPELAEMLIDIAEEVIPVRKGRKLARLAFAASRSVVRSASKHGHSRERRDPPDDYSI
jgi:hypothetical protein